MLVEGTITHLTKFGAFARLDEDLEGLIHVSELSEQRVGHPKEVVHEGDVVTLRVIKVDPERRRIGLSLRKVDSPAYADLDWKMALADEVGKAQDTEVEASVAEAPHAEVEEAKVEAPQAEAPQAEVAEVEIPEAEAPQAEAPEAEVLEAEEPQAEVEVEETPAEDEEPAGEEAETE
jgi:small subunit ribosomal protein S1